LTRLGQCGNTAVSVLIALAIGLFLTFAMLQVYVGSKRTYRAVEATARIQEGARFASEVLARDIRMAGYLGCSGSARKTVNVLADASSFFYDFGTPIQGYDATTDGTWSPPLEGGLTAVAEGTDVLVIRGLFGSEHQIADTADVANCSTAALILADTADLRASDIVVAGGCEAAAVFQATSINGAAVAHSVTTSTPGNARGDLGFCFAGNGTLGRLSTRMFFIRQKSSGLHSLYRTDVSGSNADTEELIEGVEDMQLMYGVDTNGDGAANTLLPAVDISDWEQVTSVRISLLFASVEDNVATAEQGYYFNGQSARADDKRIRRAFTTTLGLRNRLP
jgi:type IV pilus assembly protein PilW